MKKSKKTTLIALSVSTALAATVAIPVVLTACNSGDSEQNNSNNNTQPQPQPPQPQPHPPQPQQNHDKPTETKKEFSQEIAQKLYDLINNKTKLDKTIDIQTAKNTLENKAFLNEIKTILTIQSDVQSLVVNDLNIITITLTAAGFNNAHHSVSNTNISVNDKTITIVNNAGLFLPSFTTQNAESLYNSLKSILGNLDTTFTLSSCQNKIKEPGNYEKVKNALGINVDITDIVLNYNTIAITLSSNYYSNNQPNFDWTDITYTIKPKIIQMDRIKPFFASNYAEFNNQIATNLYNAIDTNIVKLDKTVDMETAQNELNTQNAKDKIKEVLKVRAGYRNATVNSLNDITFEFPRADIDNSDITVNGVRYTITQNKILKMSNPKGFFTANLIPFDKNEAEQIYDKLDIYFDLSGQTLTLAEAQQEAKNQDAINDINSVFNGNATVKTIDVTETTLTINLNKPYYKKGEYNEYQNANISANGKTITLTYNGKPTDSTAKTGFWATTQQGTNSPAITEQNANAIYDAIFGNNKVTYSSDTPQTAKAIITKLKNDIQTVLGSNTTINEIIVPNNDEIQLKVSNPALFKASNINTSADKNSVNVSFAKSILKLSKPGMFQSTNVQPLLPETVADIYNSLFGQNKLTKGQQLNEAATLLETNKDKFIKAVSGAIGGVVNITDFWVYDHNWLVVELKEYPFTSGDSQTISVKLENGLTVKIDVKDVAGKHALSIYLDKDSVFSYVDINTEMGVGIYNAINSITPLDRTLYWWQVRDGMGPAKQGIADAFKLPSKYISWGNYADKIDIRSCAKLVAYSGTINIGQEVNNLGTVIQTVTNHNPPGTTMLTIRLANWDQGLFKK